VPTIEVDQRKNDAKQDQDQDHRAIFYGSYTKDKAPANSGGQIFSAAESHAKLSNTISTAHWR